MVLEFTKMNGAGNDFILMDNRIGALRLTPEQVVALCHRQRGIGADGLVLLVPCISGRADWAWDFYNSDGSVAEMCGNASRCFARYVQRLTGGSQGFTFETGAGIITVRINDGQVTVNLTTPKDWCLNRTLTLESGRQTVHSLNTGVPHAVMFVADVAQVRVQSLGAEIRYHPDFAPRGTNVNFVQLLGDNAIRVRTYERGVEGETLACGTGVTASALAAARVHQLHSPVRVQVRGGDWLEVGFTEQNSGYDKVQLTGPADFVFEGRIEL